MSVGPVRIQVRDQDAEFGAIGEMNPLVGMTTLPPNAVFITAINEDGTVLVSGGSSVGASGIGVNPQDLVVSSGDAVASTVWPTGADVLQFNHRTKTTSTTIM